MVVVGGSHTVVVWAAAAAWPPPDAHQFHVELQYGFADGSLGASELSPVAASEIQGGRLFSRARAFTDLSLFFNARLS